jgi:flagellar basal-body rod protein FlgC
MLSAINNALSGLNAAGRRLENNANNIANQFSTSTILNGKQTDQPYTPTRVQSVSQENGGVRTVTTAQNPATMQMYDPTNPAANEDGLVTLPNVDTAQELVGQQIAAYDFKANLKTIQAADNLQKKLLDIIS